MNPSGFSVILKPGVVQVRSLRHTRGWVGTPSPGRACRVPHGFKTINRVTSLAVRCNDHIDPGEPAFLSSEDKTFGALEEDEDFSCESLRSTLENSHSERPLWDLILMR